MDKIWIRQMACIVLSLWAVGALLFGISPLSIRGKAAMVQSASLHSMVDEYGVRGQPLDQLTPAPQATLQSSLGVYEVAPRDSAKAVTAVWGAGESGVGATSAAQKWWNLTRLLTLNGGAAISGRTTMVLDAELAQLIGATLVITPSNSYQVVWISEGQTPAEVAYQNGWTSDSIAQLNGIPVPNKPVDRDTALVLPSTGDRAWEIIAGAQMERRLGGTAAIERILNQSLEKAGVSLSERRWGVELGLSGEGSYERPALTVMLIKPCLRDFDPRLTPAFVSDSRAEVAYAVLFDFGKVTTIPLDWQKGERAAVSKETSFPGIRIWDWWGKGRMIDLASGEEYSWGQWPKKELVSRRIGDVILVDRSDRLDIKWRNEQSMAKIQEAFLVMWAKKLYTTPEDIRTRLAEGQKIVEIVTYPELQPGGGTEWRSKPVDLSNPVTVVLWDESVGYGSGDGQRLRFGVDNEALTLYIYPSSKVRDVFPAVSGIAEALVMVWNLGESSPKDALDIFPEFWNLLVIPDGQGWYAPEIETIWK